jgi:hypothetical protein
MTPLRQSDVDIPLSRAIPVRSWASTLVAMGKFAQEDRYRLSFHIYVAG